MLRTPTLPFILLLNLVALTARPADTGLYDLLDPAHPKPFLDPVGKTTIRSMSNDNQLYYAALRAATNFSLPCSQLALIVSNKTFRFMGQGFGPAGRTFSGQAIGPNVRTSMEMTIDDASVIPEIAKYFHAEIIDRHHPGHHMLVQFVPDKKKFSLGEPVTVTFRITNVGNTNFTFWNGGRTRMATRNNQFAFTAEVWSKVVPDTGNPEHMGGLAGPVMLKPGENFEIPSVDMKKWFRFDQEGWCKIRGSYYMRFGMPDESEWEDFACAEFTVIVE